MCDAFRGYVVYMYVVSPSYALFYIYVSPFRTVYIYTLSDVAIYIRYTCRPVLYYIYTVPLTPSTHFPSALRPPYLSTHAVHTTHHTHTALASYALPSHLQHTHHTPPVPSSPFRTPALCGFHFLSERVGPGEYGVAPKLHTPYNLYGLLCVCCKNCGIYIAGWLVRIVYFASYILGYQRVAYLVMRYSY